MTRTGTALMQHRIWVWLAAAFIASGAEAQNPQGRGATGAAAPAGATGRAGATGASSPIDSTATARAAGGGNRLSETVRLSDGRMLEGATVIVMPTQGAIPSNTKRDTTDRLGRFTIDSLAAGNYDIRVEHGRAARGFVQRVNITGTSVGDIIVPPSARTTGWGTFATLLCLILYTVIILAARWHNIARSIHTMLYRQLTALSTRLTTEIDGNDSVAASPAGGPINPGQQRIDEIKALSNKLTELKQTLGGGKGNAAASTAVRQIEHELALIRDRPLNLDPKIQRLFHVVEDLKKDFHPSEWGKMRKGRIWEFFFWSRGRENAAWVAIHEVERQLAAFLAPPEYVEASLHWAEAQLRVVGTAPAVAVAQSIVMVLQPPAEGDTTTPESRAKARKALLGRATAIINAERDTSFSTLMEWQNKASWLILAAVIIIGFLALTAGNAVLFLAGAAGGFLSRVMRALKREDVPLDYGASWTTLFLSPLFGALAGWFGVAVIELATSSNVKLLGEAFNIVDWYDPLGPATIGTAFLLGFSERFFDAVVGAVERHAAGAQAAQQAALVSATPPPAPAGAASAGAVQPPPSAANGVKIELPDGPLPVTAVGGKVILDKPAQASTGVILSTSNKLYTAQPSAITIKAGESEAEFDVVPTGQPPGDKVRVTARLGNVSVSDTIDYQ